MSVQPVPHLSFDDWLAAERAATDARSEFVDGEIFAMTGGTEEHNLISVNVSAELRAQFKRRPCYVYAGDMKVRVDTDNVGAYPDIMAVCGERTFHDQRRDIITNPTLIIEILSDSTEAYDRGDKFAHYRQLPSLKTYVLISQHRVAAELYVRQDDGRWLLSTYDSLADTVPLESVDASLALAEVYDKLELPDTGE
ncbi:MAG: Uma2 family endonuclease [Thiohalocapsa sp.]|uniref:Uma2 family endonuclease n=1 Tax=Thiohalocapsa sp. TaxID=2497641 RepID=UPI0026015C59|nr:Uma2 family endonuclease [Thiohalocapsa sp.]MCG6942119.1 Uma2 family endonuclease [Thiohalocapsa sp.]